MASDDLWILGIHMTKFGKHTDLDVVDLAAEAALGALADGGVTMADMGVLAAGNLMNAAAGIGQQLQKQIGQTGIPVYNVANASATGATALRTAAMAVKAGEADYGLAVGVEKLAGAGLLAGGSRGGDSKTWTPKGRFGAVAPVDGRIGTDTMPGVFAQIGMEYGHKYGGTSFELFAKISEKNHAHSALNPLAAYQKRFTLEEIMGDLMIAYPNTRPMCSANTDGAAAAVVVNGATLKTLSLEQQRRAVKISASILTSDPYTESCQVLPDVNTLTRRAVDQAYEAAGVGPEDLDLVELHDCFATAELVHYDNLRLCEESGAVDFFESGATWRTGTTPVNVSGGLESKGHPIAATGIANIWEVATHLRGEAGDRQIEGAKVGLAHVIGLGSACGVHILEKSRGMSDGRLDGKVALITGGAAGIGLATTRRFVSEGARVVIGDIAVGDLEKVAAELGDSVATLRCDVTQEDDVVALVALAVERFGQLDIAVANAGTGTAALLVDHTIEEWRRVIDLCLTGVFLTVKHAGRAITEAGGGALINIASLNAIQAGRGMGAYCSAKAGVAMLTEVAAIELGPKGIRCNAIAPGFVYTQLTGPVAAVPGVIEEYIENTPLGRGAQPEEIADVALFLASQESSFMNGALVSVDGGAQTQRYPDIIGGFERMMAAGT